jgi:hypothetical protein
MKSFLTMFLGALCISASVVINIFDSLQITENDAKKCLLLSIGAGGVMRGDHSDLVSNARALPVEQQVEGIRQLMKLAKEYTATEEFKKDYKKWREQKLNPETKSKLGVPKLGKMLENKVDQKLNKEENEKKYPSAPADMVRKRLTDFLEVSANVDFDAKLEGWRFVNPDYEKKPAEWKMCYRAGKEVVMAAREEAQKWLDELNSNK